MQKLTSIVIALAMTVIVMAQKPATTEKVSIRGHHGNLAAIIERPAGADKVPMVVIMHGFSGNKNEPLHQTLAKKLADKGIATLRFDFNGHGESEGEFQKMTVPNEVEDALCVCSYAASLPWVKSISIAGHSQGGVVASLVAAKLQKQVKKLVLMAPAAVLRDDAIRGNTMGAFYNPINPPEYVEIFGGALKLGRDYILEARNLRIYETARNYKGKACIIHGTGDVVVPFTYGERYAEGYRKPTLHLIDGADHVFSQHTDTVTDIATLFLAE